MDGSEAVDLTRRAHIVRSDLEQFFGVFFPDVLVTETGGTDAVDFEATRFFVGEQTDSFGQRVFLGTLIESKV